MKSPVWFAALFTTVAHAQMPPTPPAEALAACSSRTNGSACAFQAPRGEVRGSCRPAPSGLACVPTGGPPPAAAAPDARRLPARTSTAAPPFGADIAATGADAQGVTSRIPDTNQGSCFDARGAMPCPAPGQPFYGQDAQYAGASPHYRVVDGIVVDDVTDLMWQQAHNSRRLDWPQAQQACAALRLGGYDDWRLPSIRELFSIADFRGSAGRRPYLDERFEIHAPDPEQLRGDRFAASHTPQMMGQTWSATLYAGDHWGRPGVQAAFFMNFLDGHLKQAPTAAGGMGLFYRCVRGRPWGDNDFVDNHDGTVSDRASGLTWQQQDDGRGRNWQQALAYCESLQLAGRRDWRLPNVKELQSLVDYRRAPPAIDPRFFRLSNPEGWFWSSTTHGDDVRQADYLCFGKCTSIEGVDVHGAGAQRSDPKQRSDRSATFQGGQRDEVRIENYVRCVR